MKTRENSLPLAKTATGSRLSPSCTDARSGPTTVPRNSLSLLLRFLVCSGAALTFSVLIYLIGFILVKGIPYITPSLFSLGYTTENVSLLPAAVTTIMIIALALVIAVPLGVFSAVYLVEYAPRGSKIVQLIRITTETLSGIPSIIYGLFGLLFFVTFLGWGFSLLAGAFTTAMMILPLIMRTAEEALMAVSDTYREASFGLGAGRLRTVFRVVLPSAVPGILAGVILGIGRIVGEAAALIYTAGTVPEIPENMTASGRTLAVHMYALSSEGLSTDQAYATGVVLLVLVLLINGCSRLATKKIGKGDIR